MIHDARFELPEIDINIKGDVLVFDKPYQCTSFDLVEKVKKYICKKYQQKVKVGHAGTLDPLASGVMIICIGAFTKKIEQYQALEKEYTGTFLLGATTPSFDLERPVDTTFSISHITKEKIEQIAHTFIGTQEQIPPCFSAVKVDGKRAYLLAREGKEPEIKSKIITIYKFEILKIVLPEVDFKVVCSKGTYIRSLARDFGKKLESGAHLKALRRIRIGEFKVEDALNVKEFGIKKI